MKEGSEELERIISGTGFQVRSIPPSCLFPYICVLILKIMRQYIYKLSDLAPIKFIVFVGSENRFLGYTTINKFKAKFPR